MISANVFVSLCTMIMIMMRKRGKKRERIEREIEIEREQNGVLACDQSNTTGHGGLRERWMAWFTLTAIRPSLFGEHGIEMLTTSLSRVKLLSHTHFLSFSSLICLS